AQLVDLLEQLPVDALLELRELDGEGGRTGDQQPEREHAEDQSQPPDADRPRPSRPSWRGAVRHAVTVGGRCGRRSARGAAPRGTSPPGARVRQSTAGGIQQVSPSHTTASLEPSKVRAGAGTSPDSAGALPDSVAGTPLGTG